MINGLGNKLNLQIFSGCSWCWSNGVKYFEYSQFRLMSFMLRHIFLSWHVHLQVKQILFLTSLQLYLCPAKPGKAFYEWAFCHHGRWTWASKFKSKNVCRIWLRKARWHQFVWNQHLVCNLAPYGWGDMTYHSSWAMNQLHKSQTFKPSHYSSVV